MRGSSLSSPAVLAALRPFIVAVWNGRRPEDMPDDVREVYQAASRTRRQTNILLCVLDAAGRLVRAFPPFPGSNPGSLGFDPQRMGEYLRREIELGVSSLEVPKVEPRRALTLPDVSSSQPLAGVRLLVSFANSRMGHYRTPVVEALATRPEEREALRYPTGARSLPAAALRRWLEQYYPPAVMDGLGGFDKIAGSLRLEPAGQSADARYAVLRGEISFALDNQAATEYRGQVQLVVRYAPDSGEPVSLRGILDGDFPRQDRTGRTMELVRMTAAIESRPN